MSDIQTRRLEEKERRRCEIIDAAEQVFGEVGFDAATMLQIARRARLSRALVYIYFRDKAELQFAIAERAGQHLTQRFEEAVARNRSGLDQIEAIGRAYLAFAQEFPVYFNAIALFESLVADTTAGSAYLDAMFVGTSIHLFGSGKDGGAAGFFHLDREAVYHIPLPAISR